MRRKRADAIIEAVARGAARATGGVTMNRYRAFKMPISGQWGAVDRNVQRYLAGVRAEDEAAAVALAHLLNGEFENGPRQTRRPSPSP
jgi:hypothetical protein